MLTSSRTEGDPGMSRPSLSRALPVPSGRLARLTGFGGVMGSVAGGLAAGGLRELARGRRPELRSLVLTPANAARLADELARMRGAAMKVGQLVSMDAGEILPPEIAEPLARLRAEAHHMPPRQLREVLDAEWGAGWQRRFAQFEVRPVAAASIGQVHRATLPDGRRLAIKVQYPGVRRSIDSDVANLGGLLRMSGVVPRGVDLAPLLEAARTQLHEEADYRAEGARMTAYAAMLAGQEDFHVPAVHDDLTTDNVLVMDYADSQPLESLEQAPQETRDRVVGRLLGLALRELFDFRVMQTDPNLANYRHDPVTGRLVLLDFGAVREIPAWLSEGFRSLLAAGRADDPEALERAALELGYLTAGMPAAQRADLVDLMRLSLEPLRRGGVFDFGSSDMARRVTEAGEALSRRQEASHVPPVDALFVQRKLGGMYLMATRLRARIDLDRLMAPALGARAAA
jgi:predicted unusual protein kinase regulating ubiquinone biosynthesis (AarF/ABC1/UbiB family)